MTISVQVGDIQGVINRLTAIPVGPKAHKARKRK